MEPGVGRCGRPSPPLQVLGQAAVDGYGGTGSPVNVEPADIDLVLTEDVVDIVVGDGFYAIPPI